MASENNSKEKAGETETASHSESSSTEPLKGGVCKWFNVLKGWGFLTPDDGSQEVFVHQSVIRMPGFRSLGEGERVEFRSHETERGVEATMVTGPTGDDCKGSTVRPLGKKKFRRIRCFNCGQFGNHVASKCRMGQLPKCCYHCKGTDHLIADCPQRSKESGESSSAMGSSSEAGREESDQRNSKNHVQSDDASAREEEKAKPVEKKENSSA